MSRDQKSDGVKAVWTLIRNVTLSGGQLVSIYFSEGGAFKATYHTDRGEMQACMFPLAQLEILSQLAPEFASMQDEYMSRKDAIDAKKAEQKEVARIEKIKEKALKHALLEQHAAEQRLARVNAFLKEQGITTKNVG